MTWNSNNEGRVIWITGLSGAGKSTIASLLPRYYDPQQGAIRIGGHDLRALPLDILRHHIASVPQDVFLFHGSVRDNLLFGKPEANEEQLIAAAHAANERDRRPAAVARHRAGFCLNSGGNQQCRS